MCVRVCVCVFVRVGGWACACVGGERFSNSNRIIPSDYRILLLLKMPIPNINMTSRCVNHVYTMPPKHSSIITRNQIRFNFQHFRIRSKHLDKKKKKNTYETFGLSVQGPLVMRICHVDQQKSARLEIYRSISQHYRQ